jgi:hypothetical protein
VPVLKSDIGTVEVSKKIFRPSAVNYSWGWWALLDTIVDEMTILRSAIVQRGYRNADFTHSLPEQFFQGAAPLP